MAVSLGIDIVRNSYDASSNCSNVTVRLTVYYSAGSYNGYNPAGTLYINDTPFDFTCNFNYNSSTGEAASAGSGSVTAYVTTFDVYHDSDGTKELYCSATFDSGTASGTVGTTKSAILTSTGTGLDPDDSEKETALFDITVVEGSNVSIIVRNTSGDLLNNNNTSVGSGCPIVVQFIVDDGYELITHTINGEVFDSGDLYYVYSPITIEASATLMGLVYIRPDTDSTISPYEIYIDTLHVEQRKETVAVTDKATTHGCFTSSDNSISWLLYDEILKLYLGNSLTEKYVSCVRFKPEFNGALQTMMLSVVYGSIEPSNKSITICYALCTSDKNRDRYLTSGTTVDDEYQIIAGSGNYSTESGLSITIVNKSISSGTNMYLFLWVPDDTYGYIEGASFSASITSLPSPIQYNEYIRFIPYIDTGTEWVLCN